jgi:hypothetical protein
VAPLMRTRSLSRTCSSAMNRQSRVSNSRLAKRASSALKID